VFFSQFQPKFEPANGAGMGSRGKLGVVSTSCGVIGIEINNLASRQSIQLTAVLSLPADLFRTVWTSGASLLLLSSRDWQSKAQ